MTRVNLVHPVELCNQHLLAEYKEIPRLHSLLTKHYLNKGKEVPDITEFSLGKNHMKFFLNKFEFLYRRHRAISKELRRRGYNLFHDSTLFQQVPIHLFNDWQPTQKDINLSRQRILDKLPKNATWRRVNV